MDFINNYNGQVNVSNKEVYQESLLGSENKYDYCILILRKVMKEKVANFAWSS